MASRFGSIFKRLESRELIVPHLEAAILADAWPDAYDVNVDSSPYYGTRDVDGEGGKGGAGDGYAHPSSHMFMNECQLYYAFHPAWRGLIEPKRWTMGSMVSVAVGTAIHAILQVKLVECGLSSPDNIEYEYIDEDNRTRGRIDMICDSPGYGMIVGDIKTANPRSFAMTEVATDKFIGQVSMGLDNFDKSMKEGAIVMVEMAYPWRLKELRVKKDERMLGEFYERWDRVRTLIELDTPPHCDCLPSVADKCPSSNAYTGIYPEGVK